MNQFLDFAPIAIFAAVFFLTDAPDNIYYATAALIVGVGLQLAFYKLTNRPITSQLQITFWISLVFGGLTLFLRDAVFIQWKPTIVNWFFAAALLVSHYLLKVNLLEKLLSSQMQLPAAVWQNLSNGWALGFFTAGVLNLLVAYNFSMDFWVGYKLVGGFGLTFIYVLITIIYLSRGGFLEEPDRQSEQETNSSAQDRS